MASSDRSRSDRMDPLSGRVVSQMQAVSSPVPGESISSSSPDVPIPHRSMEVSRHNSQLNSSQSYELHQHNHQVNVPQISNEFNQQVLHDNRQVNMVHVSTDPLVVAQAHQAVADARNDAFQYACQVQSQAHDFASNVQAQANAFVESQTRDIRYEALGEIDRMHNQAASLVDRVQADASQQVTQAHEESRRAQEVTEKIKAEATQIIHQAQGETRQAVASRQEIENELHRKDQMLILAKTQFDEMQSQMHQMLAKMKQQEVLIRELSEAREQRVESPPPNTPPSQHPVASPSSFNLTLTEASPIKPILPCKQKGYVPLPVSIATPKANSHYCAEMPEPAYQCVPSAVQSGLPKAGGAMLQAPPPSWGCQGQGQGVQGSSNAVGSSLEAQVHDLSIQLASLHQIMFQQSQSQGILPQFHNTAVHGILPNVSQPVGSPGQRSNRSQNSNPDPNGSSSSSSSASRRGHGGGGGGSPGGTPQSNGGSDSSDSNEDPYRREKRLMRVKHYESMKLPAIPHDAAKCRSFRNQVYSLVCKMAKGNETPVFNWINVCNTAEDETRLRTNDFPVLDRTLGAKLLESAAKNPKFAMEFQTIQEKAQQRGRLPKGRYLLWYIFQKFRLDRDRGTALSQHHLLSLKISSDQTVKSLEEFKQRFDYCLGSLEVGEHPNEASLRSLLFENLKNHPKMAIAIDKFRQAAPGSRKRTSQWLYERLNEAIDISQMDTNTTSVDKALASGGDSKIAGAQADPLKKPDKPPKPTKPPKGEKPNKKPEKPDKTKPDKPGKPDKGKGKKEEVDAAAAEKGKGKGKGKGKTKDTREPLTKEEKAKRPCVYFAYDSCVHGEKCEYLHDKNNLYKGPRPRTKSSAAAGVATVAAATAIPTAEAAVRKAKKECRKVFKRMTPSLLPHVFSRAATAIMAAIACLNHVSLSNNVKVPAAIAPVEMSFLLDSGAGRNLMSKKDMPEFWNDRVVEPAESLVFRTGGGERKASESISLQGNVSGKNDFFVLKECPPVLSLGIQVEQHRRGFIWLPGEMPYLIRADRIQDITHFVPESAKIFASEVRENVPVITEQVEAMPAPPEGEEADDGDYEPSIAPEVPDVDLSDLVEGGEPSSSKGPIGDPISEPPKAVAPPIDIPKSKKGDLKLKEDLPHFGDELELCLEKGFEPGDAPLDEEDEDNFPWEPNLRERLQQEARSQEHMLTHYPKNRYCEICCRSKMTMRYHRRKALEEKEETPPLHFGHRLRADHILFGSDSKKGSEGESSCLVVQDVLRMPWFVPNECKSY